MKCGVGVVGCVKHHSVLIYLAVVSMDSFRISIIFFQEFSSIGKRFWLVNLNPHQGTESGKIRPVLIVQAQAS